MSATPEPEIKPLLLGLERLVDSGFLREAVWVIVGLCQKFKPDWILDENRIKLVTFGVRLAAEQGPPNFACLGFLVRLLDEALFSATTGVPLVRPQLLEEMNTARVGAAQLLYRSAPLPLVSLEFEPVIVEDPLDNI